MSEENEQVGDYAEQALSSSENTNSVGGYIEAPNDPVAHRTNKPCASHLDANGEYVPLVFCKPTVDTKIEMGEKTEMNQIDRLVLLGELGVAANSGEFSSLNDILIKLAILLDDFNMEAPAEIEDEDDDPAGAFYVSSVPDKQDGAERLNIKIGLLTFRVFVFERKVEVWTVITEDGLGKKVAETLKKEENEEVDESQQSVAGEIEVSLPAEVEAKHDELCATLVDTPPSVISEDPVDEDVDEKWAKAQIGMMNEAERSNLMERIEEMLHKKQPRGLNEVVDLVGECMPDGVKKPKLCDKESSRVIQVVEDEVPDQDMIIDFNIMGMPNKMFVGENGVKIYVSFGSKYVLYAK